MAKMKLFNFKGVEANELPTELLLDQDLCSYYFSVVWTRDKSAITLTSVVSSPFGRNDWTQHLNTVTTESDGEIDISIGIKRKASKLDLIFSLNPHQNISDAVIYIVNHSNGEYKQVSPEIGSKSLTKAKPWAETLTITLP